MRFIAPALPLGMRFEIQFLFPKFTKEQEKAMMEQKLKEMDHTPPPPKK